MALVVVGHASSPIDLIPDPTPILGRLDGLVLLPLAIRLATPGVMAEHRATAAGAGRPVGRLGAALVVASWALAAAGLPRWLRPGAAPASALSPQPSGLTAVVT